MAKIRNNKPPQETKLIIPQYEFRQKLEERLKLGKVLQEKSQNFKTVPELEMLENEYGKWDSYNSELLKVSFNNENNEYKKEYDDTGMMDGFKFIMGGGNINDPEYRAGKLERNIMTHILSIEDLINKHELIKVEERNEISMESENNSISRTPKKKLQAELENLVINNKLNEALEKIKAEYPELRLEVNLHLSNLNDVKEKERIGVQDQRNTDLKIIRIRVAILDVIEK